MGPYEDEEPGAWEPSEWDVINANEADDYRHEADDVDYDEDDYQGDPEK